jgi:acetyl-CoA decarbonylase/synthase complex subunit delta
MAYTAPLETHPVKIRETVLGTGAKTVAVGGEDTLPLHSFEGSLPNPPAVALEVLDMAPENWVQWVTEPYGDVLSDPAAWARKCVETYGAGVLFLRLQSTDPVGGNASPAAAAETARKVLDAVDVPLIVWGTGNERKDAAVACSGKNIALGPVLKGNYEEIARAAMAHGHTVIAQASMDANLTKELNIALCKFFPADRIVIDPTASALGYGLEYTFSIIESIKLFGLVDKDNMMQMPVFSDTGVECWRTKEAKESREQGILWETMTCLTFLLAGANLLVVRHPDSLRLIRQVIQE